jgi:hypothetical protein
MEGFPSRQGGCKGRTGRPPSSTTGSTCVSSRYRAGRPCHRGRPDRAGTHPAQRHSRRARGHAAASRLPGEPHLVLPANTNFFTSFAKFWEKGLPVPLADVETRVRRWHHRWSVLHEPRFSSLFFGKRERMFALLFIWAVRALLCALLLPWGRSNFMAAQSVYLCFFLFVPVFKPFAIRSNCLVVCFFLFFFFFFFACWLSTEGWRRTKEGAGRFSL